MILAKLPMSQPLALEGIQECWWQTGTQTNSQAGLSLIALIVPLMEADKVTSPLCCFLLCFFICFSPYKTRVNSPDVVAMTTLSLGAADAGKGFLQFNPPGNLPIRGCW